MADIVGSHQISSSKRSWSESLNVEGGSERLPDDESDIHQDFQAKRIRHLADGETPMDDYEISNGSLPSCYESGSDSAEKSVRVGDSNSGGSPTTSGRPLDSYGDPSLSSHSTDSNFYDEVENGSPAVEARGSPATSPRDSDESRLASISGNCGMDNQVTPIHKGSVNSDSLEQDDDDDADNVSTISDLSGISIERWRPIAGPMSWVQRQMQAGIDPRQVLRQLVPPDTMIPEDFDDLTLWKIVINLIAEPPKRCKLKEVNTLDDAISLLQRCKRIMVLTGAGVSVSCGIPDFRSRDGIYSRLAVEYPDLPDPQAMFDINYFRRNPRPFFKFAKEIYPGQFDPSPSHRFIALLESKGKLLRNYTQNIDTLEQVAGIDNVIQCHGSFATATCMVCKYKVDKEVVKEDIINQVIPRCPNCPADEEDAIMKPDIVFFGESLPSEFHRQMEVDREVCDLLIVIGSSLKVRPVALIPDSLPPEVPQILINREPLRHLNFDIELLGDCDIIVNELCQRLGRGWQSVCTLDGPSRQISRDELLTPISSRRPSPVMASPTTTSDMVATHVPKAVSSNEDSMMSTPVLSNLPSSSTAPAVTDPAEGRRYASFHISHDDSSQASMADSSLENDAVPQAEGTDASSVRPDGLPPNDSSASLCSLVRHLSTGQHETLEGSSSRCSMDSANSEEKKETTLSSEADRTAALEATGQQGSTEGTVSSVSVTGIDKMVPPSIEVSAASVDQSCTEEVGSGSQAAQGTEGSSEKTKAEEESKLQDEINDLEDLRACWEPKVINLASRLQDGTYLFLPPCRYIFHGAEVYDENETEDDITQEDDDSSSSCSSDDEKDLLDDSKTSDQVEGSPDEVSTSKHLLDDIPQNTPVDNEKCPVSSSVELETTPADAMLSPVTGSDPLLQDPILALANTSLPSADSCAPEAVAQPSGSTSHSPQGTFSTADATATTLAENVMSLPSLVQHPDPPQADTTTT